MDTVDDSTVDETSSVATIAMADYAFALVPILSFAGHYVKKQSLGGLSLLGYGWVTLCGSSMAQAGGLSQMRLLVWQASMKARGVKLPRVSKSP